MTPEARATAALMKAYSDLHPEIEANQAAEDVLTLEDALRDRDTDLVSRQQTKPTGGSMLIREDSAAPFVRCPACGERISIAVPTGLTIQTPTDMADHFIPLLGTLDREELWVAILNTKNRVLATERIYQGNVSFSLVRIAELFRSAVRLTANSIILVHNHPSGDPTPSPDDLHLTAEALAAGRLLNVDVLDHLIIAGHRFVSLRDRGIAFGHQLHS